MRDLNPRAGFPTYALHWGVAAGSATAFSGWLGTRALTEELMERVKVEKIPL